MPPLPPDPYKALGVPKTAQIPDIRTAYRKLVLTCHPDKVHDPTQKTEKLQEFQKIQHAYELLSDDKERAKYDQQVKLMELRKAVPKNVPNTSAPRTPKTHVHVYTTAEPRPSPYAQSPPQAGARVYAQYSPASNEEFGFADDEGAGRSAKRPQSYEKASSRKEKELEEEKERERADRVRRRREKEEAQEEREKEKEKERERERRLSDKESRKAEKKRQDKERKQAHEDKHRNRSGAYVEEYTSDKDTARPEKKKPSSRKTRERERERESTPKLDLVDKTNGQRMRAEEYIKRRANIDRSATADATTFRNSPPSVPTPPPPRDSPYAPPPVPEDDDDDDDDDEEEEPVHHPRAASRRGSYDPSRSREPGFMHKKSFSSVIDDPVHLSTSPGRLSAMATESPPRGSLPKSGTFHESPRSAARPIIPTMPRSHTYAGETHESRHSRGRSRSRFQPQRVPEMEEEDEVEMRQHLKGYRTSRRETPTDPIPIYPSKPYEGRSLGRESSYRDSFERSPKYFASSGSSEYVEPAYSYPRAHYSKVRTTKRFEPSDVNIRRYGEAAPYEINAYH